MVGEGKMAHRRGKWQGAFVFVDAVSGLWHPNCGQNRHQNLTNVRHDKRASSAFQWDTCSSEFGPPASWFPGSEACPLSSPSSGVYVRLNESWDAAWSWGKAVRSVLSARRRAAALYRNLSNICAPIDFWSKVTLPPHQNITGNKTCLVD